MKLRLLFVALASGSLACAAVGSDSGAPTLEKTHWTLASLGAGRVPVATTQTEPFLVFGAEPGRVTGSGGCNRLTGPYEQKADAIKFGALAATRMACEHGMDTEDALGTALGAASSWKIVGDQLELYDAGGTLLASFKAGS
jgi:putative lipoprotein